MLPPHPKINLPSIRIELMTFAYHVLPSQVILVRRSNQLS
jgi:hypothetical protein